MRLSRANIPLASEDRTHSQAISPSPHYNLAPHYRPGFINLQHFCHSRWRNPVRLSKSGNSETVLAAEDNEPVHSHFHHGPVCRCHNFSGTNENHRLVDPMGLRRPRCVCLSAKIRPHVHLPAQFRSTAETRVSQSSSAWEHF